MMNRRMEKRAASVGPKHNYFHNATNELLNLRNHHHLEDILQPRADQTRRRRNRVMVRMSFLHLAIEGLKFALSKAWWSVWLTHPLFWLDLNQT